MKRYLISILFSIVAFSSFGQVPSTCFEIESILVNACGNPEGANEMVRFRIGPTAMNTSNLSVSWPNNGWLGVCQNASTSASVAQLNSTVQNCGLLLEPVGGVLPAGAQVILVSSVNFNPAFNSFAGLSDTIYVIFQCTGNTSGHFANSLSAGQTRTLSMTFGGPGGCSDAVTYGSGIVNTDGATANFTWAGNASYATPGCNAPFTPQILDAGTSGTACGGDTIQLSGTASGSFSSFQWSGGAGTILNPGSLNAQYVVGASESGTISLTLTGTRCIGQVTDNVSFTLSPLPSVSVSPSGPQSICAGDILNLTATFTGNLQWSNGLTTPAIQVTTTGTYTATVTNACGSSASAVTVTSGNAPVATISPNSNLTICGSQTIQLTASGGVNYLWSTSATSNSITVSSAGVYSVIASNGCGSDTAQVTVTADVAPSVSITQGMLMDTCSSTPVQLDATGTGTISWPGISPGNTVTVNASGTYIAIATNSCGTDTAAIVVGFQPSPSVTLPSSSYTICPGGSVLLAPQYQGNLLWSGGSTAATESISVPGSYSVTASNSCGSQTFQFTVIASQVNAAFTVDSVSGQSPLTVNFTNQSVNAVSYDWNFGDGGSSTDASPTHVYSQPGTYVAILTVTNSDGCQDTASITIDVQSCIFQLFIPNVFTPNNDGLNDEYFVVSPCAARTKITIFNRWGAEIRTLNGINDAWDGLVGIDNKAAEGVYVYLVEILDVNGDHHRATGMFTLLR